jgi:hypothetical protein
MTPSGCRSRFRFGEIKHPTYNPLIVGVLA